MMKPSSRFIRGPESAVLLPVTHAAGTNLGYHRETGMDVGRATGRRLIALSLAVVAVGLAACGSAPHPTAKHTTPTPHVAPTPAVVTFEDKYAAIKAGMSVDDVRSLMGSAGSTLSEADAPGASSMVIQWQDPKSSHSITVDFVNSVMQSKVASGF